MSDIREIDTGFIESAKTLEKLSPDGSLEGLLNLISRYVAVRALSNYTTNSEMVRAYIQQSAERFQEECEDQIASIEATERTWNKTHNKTEN